MGGIPVLLKCPEQDLLDIQVSTSESMKRVRHGGFLACAVNPTNCLITSSWDLYYTSLRGVALGSSLPNRLNLQN